jgi:hypothetical protein
MNIESNEKLREFEPKDIDIVRAVDASSLSKFTFSLSILLLDYIYPTKTIY